MADFQFTIDDLLDFSDGEGITPKAKEAMLREYGRHYSGDLSTTASRNGFSGTSLSTLSLGEMLMGQTLVKDPVTVMNRYEYLTSTLLGGSLQAEDNPNGSLGGVFDHLVPDDIKSYVARKRNELGLTVGGTNPSSDGATSGPAGAYDTESYSFMAEQLISHPNFYIQGQANKDQDWNRVLGDLRDGLINPWLIATLKILCDNFAIYVGNFDASKTSGHMTGSQHYAGNAVDVGRVGPKGSTWGDRVDEVEDNTPIVQEVLNCLNSIHAPWRPSTVICSAFPAFGGGQAVTIEGTRFTANADHGLGSAGNGHFHIDCKVRPDPSEIPPPGRGTTSTVPTGGPVRFT